MVNYQEVEFPAVTVDLDSKNFGTTLEQTPSKDLILIVAVFEAC